MVVGAVYLILTLVAFSTWLKVADLSKVPLLMASYLFPYPYAIRGFGGASCIVVMLLQSLVIFSIYYAVVKKRGKDTLSNTLASVTAVVWYGAVSFIIVVAHIH